MKYNFVFFLTPETSFSVGNTAKHILFKIAIVNRSRNDFVNISVYCNSVASRGHEEQTPSQQTFNEKSKAKKDKNHRTYTR